MNSVKKFVSFIALALLLSNCQNTNQKCRSFVKDFNYTASSFKLQSSIISDINAKLLEDKRS